MRVVIAGYGMAGARLARELGGRGAEVTVFGAESEAAYNRVLLSGLLAGSHSETGVRLPPPPDNVDIRLDTPVSSIDTVGRTVNGVGYDALVLATGADAIMPPIPGLAPSERVMAFRTMADCRRIIEASRGGDRALVLGGGLLGVEAARGLAGRGMRVTVVHAAEHLMERQLDPAGAAMLAGTLDSIGVASRTGAAAVAVDQSGDEVRLRLADGTELSGDLLVVSCGVAPNIGLARRAGLRVNRGVVIDDRCRTSDPRVYAIGDCAEHDGHCYGLVGPAWEQADVVADVLSGQEGGYRGSRQVTRLKTDGIDLAAMGVVDGDEVVSFADPVRRTYARLVIEAGRLAGAILLGDNPTVGDLVRMFDQGEPVPFDRRRLLLGAAAPVAESADDETVCRCNSVDAAAITSAWHGGARTVEQLAAKTLATTGCGGCTDTVSRMCERLGRTELSGVRS
ncbi:FAD-dependent oxidoreductase [Stackebrandtia nassauensis]|uniref:FAD-dependent pyridine nucleotide-disulfide oxidoreductase n=1 Tax=Stackebrandtia nassauensis (strain DSM 44728 / CIP 108903 / NRRL B-16338 / NBRC 102104 / LLR-40K-21) TaxID=446470 RepID=D3Q7C8_STANL|nr:FAD-dependent oxidoreductase [Stackebrandtia nassauensis]ADD42399.1 FAD-dependent pyridine nucleotide-disulfide oxidoreductase [Stackebrandtia nassauensis DSM 44728]